MPWDDEDYAWKKFGGSRVPAELLRLCRDLRPSSVPRSLNSSGRAPVIRAVSERLLVGISESSGAEYAYAFLRVNAGALRDVATTRIKRDALPLSLDALCAEVFAEVTDAARTLRKTQVGALYRSVPAIVSRVANESLDEILGFVPTITRSPNSNAAGVAAALADKIELPCASLSTFPSIVDTTITRILAAQALLQLSPGDRALLLRQHELVVAENRGIDPSVAELLSANAACQRWRREFDRIVGWLRLVLDAEAPVVAELERGDESA
jgi:hypothetical protein